MKVTFRNLTGVSRNTIATAAAALLISGASYGTPRISTITFTPTIQTVCLPASGSVTVSYVLHAVRGQNGTVNGVYAISALPAGVTADFIPGFTANGNTPFPDRTLTLHVPSTTLPGDHSFTVRLYNSQGVTDQAIVTGTLILNLTPSFTSVPTSILTNTNAGICGAVVNYNVAANGYPAPTMSYTLSGATPGNGSGTGSGSIFNKGVTNVTITASNVCQPSAITSFTITVKDNEAPIMTNCPQAKTINCDESSDVLSMGYPSATDNCGAVSMSLSNESTQSADINSPAHYNYTITRTFTATDMDDNSSSCVQVITVQDITAPSVSCIENASRNTNAASCEYTVSGNEFDAIASADNCSSVMVSYSLSGATTATGSGSLNGMILNKGTTTVQWIAMDVTGNSSSCSFDVSVNDMELPVIICPANMVVETDAGVCGAMVNYNVSFSDNCPGALMGQESGIPSGSMFPVGTTTNFFTVKDASGNSASASFTITVYDDEAPSVISITKSDFNDYNVTCAGSCNGSATVNATDNCGGALTYLWSNSQTAATATDLCAGTYTVTITDGNHNSSTAEVTLTGPALLEVYAGADAVTYYGYGMNQTLNRTAHTTGGVAPYSYRWSMNRPLMCNMVTNTGDESMSSASWSMVTCPESPMNFNMAAMPFCWGSPTVTATLLDDAVIYVIVMDANGCLAADSFSVSAEDVRCFAGNSGTAKVQMCHQTGSIKNPWVQICVDADAVPSHLAHGDYIGSCTNAAARMDNSDSEESSTLSLYPNPNNGNFTVDFHSANHSDEDILVQVMSVAGNTVYSKIMSAADGHFNGLINTNDLEQGFYTIHVRQGEESLNQTFVIMK